MKMVHIMLMAGMLVMQGVAARAQDTTVADTDAGTPATAAPAAETVAADAGDSPSESRAYSMPDALADGSVSISEDDAELISISLDDVELEEVVRMFMRIADANIIATASNLTGKVSVNLTDVEWQPAMVSILDMHNLTLIEKTPGSEIYSIVSRPADALEPLVVETIFLDYATVSEVQLAIQPVLDDRARMSPFPSRNALVIKTTAANLVDVVQVVSEIDKLREQVFIEAKFLELNDQAIKDLGINWEVLQGVEVNFTDMAADYESRKDSTSSQIDVLRQFNNDYRGSTGGQLYDMNGREVVPETITLVDPFDPDGGTVALADGATHQSYDTIGAGKEFESLITDTYSRTVSQGRKAILGVSQFKVVLSALKQMNGVSVVSNPKVIVANEEPATIHVGETERPFIATVTPASDSANAFTTYNPGEPVEYGVKLTVTPTVNTSSNITVRIEPELTRFVANSVAPTGQTYPIISTKKITTQFCLEDGKTVAIGGLTETDDRDQQKKIPLLGYIPLIGKYLFSHEHTERTQKETIIFVTVGLATPSSIHPEEGLPIDAELAQMHILRQKMKRLEYLEELDATHKATLAAEAEHEARMLAEDTEETVDEAVEKAVEEAADEAAKEAADATDGEYTTEVRAAFGEGTTEAAPTE